MKMVDSVIEAVKSSGMKCNALEDAMMLPKFADMPAKGAAFSLLSRK